MMKNKKIPEMRDELEIAIKVLISDFEDKTGLTVDSVDLIREVSHISFKEEHRTLEKIKTEISLI